VASPSFTAPGILLVDKAPGLTSHDVVSRLRRILSTRRVGHAGTLDPMATGLLVMGVNGATRLLTFFVGLDKTYTATIRLGESTTTDDAEGEALGKAPSEQLARVTGTDIESAASTLTGDIMQVPSAVSAIKVDGKRAYTRVREGEAVALEPRPVTVSRFDITAVRRTDDGIDVDVVVDCSSGTYIRALARDLGFRLGVGGHLTALRRTRVGPFDIADALVLDDSLASDDATSLTSARLLEPADAAGRIFPRWQLDVDEDEHLRHGRAAQLTAPGEGRFAAISSEGRLRGLVDASAERVRILFNMSQESP
jgi:tRNA pseudouridine55 synthase